MENMLYNFLYEKYSYTNLKLRRTIKNSLSLAEIELTIFGYLDRHSTNWAIESLTF